MQDKFGNSATGTQSADSPGAIKAYRQDLYLADATASPQPAVPVQQASSGSFQVPDAPATVPLSDIPLAVQQAIASDASNVSQSELVLAQEASLPTFATATTRQDMDTAGVQGPEHSIHLPVNAVDHGQQRGMLMNIFTNNVL